MSSAWLVTALIASLSIADAPPDPLAEGLRLLDTSRFEEARLYFLRAAASAAASGNHRRHGRALRYLGNVARREGDPDEARQFFEQARRVFVASGDRTQLAHVLNNLGTVHQHRAIAQPDAALREQGLRKALALYEEALAVDRKTGAQPHAAATFVNIGVVREHLALCATAAQQPRKVRAELGRALGAHNHALSLLPAKPTERFDVRTVADALLNRGNVQFRQGKPDAALADYRECRNRSNKHGYVLLEAKASINCGYALRALGRKAKSISEFQRALTSLERLRGGFRSRKTRAAFQADLAFAYEHLVALLLEAGQLEQAFALVEQAKARVLMGILHEKALRQKLGARNAGDLARREWLISQKIDTLTEQLSQSERLSAAPAAALIGRIHALFEERQGVMASLRKADPDYLTFRAPRPPGVRTLQQLLRGDEALIEYFGGASATTVFVVTNTTMLAAPLPASPDEIADRVAAFRKHAVDTDPGDADYGAWHDALAALHTALLPPGIRPILREKKHLVVIPHGILHRVPFAALVVKKDTTWTKKEAWRIPAPQYLIERHAITYAPSANAFAFARRRDRHTIPDTTLIVANAVYPEGLSSLPGTEAEAKAIAAIRRNARVLIGARATEDAIKREGGRYGVLHLATHGELHPRRPLESRIYLTPSSGQDGRLTVSEVFDLDLHASLVWLSGCQTGQVSSFAGRSETVLPPGDDLVGLSHAFLYAGASSVGATLWSVDDTTTAALMPHFYRELTKRSAAEALQAAQVAMIHEARGDPPGYRIHPFYWAPFVLFGEAGRPAER